MREAAVGGAQCLQDTPPGRTAPLALRQAVAVCAMQPTVGLQGEGLPAICTSGGHTHGLAENAQCHAWGSRVLERGTLRHVAQGASVYAPSFCK